MTEERQKETNRTADAEFDENGLEALLDYLRAQRAFDFTGYKRLSLGRRIRRRMEQVQIADFAEYRDFLEVHPEEFDALFNTILINVTSFFRDKPVWDYLRGTMVPLILGAKGSTDPIRIWSAGCAAGQEAYSAVIMLAELLGKREAMSRVKVYATDVDEDALDQARRATYYVREIDSVPPELREKYFTERDGEWTLDRDLRRCVIFGRHDLVQDAPISRVDLLFCRNTLMYFHSELQGRVARRMRYALGDQGVLILGRVEMLVGHGDLFRPVDLKNRIFAKGPARHAQRLMGVGEIGEMSYLPPPLERLVDSAFETGSDPRIVVDSAGRLALANEAARRLFRIPTSELGRPFQDMELSYRPLELRSHIESVLHDRMPLALRDVERIDPDAGPTFLDVDVIPLVDEDGNSVGVAVAFHDVTRFRRLQDEVETTYRQLETAYEELQSANEELEATDEELQSTVEELETTNEELETMNEELETMNEELQATNDELQAINTELRDRTEQLDTVNHFLEAILGSVRGAVVVVDRDLRVRVWNSEAQDLWGLRTDEVENMPLLGLDIGLPLDTITPVLRASLIGDPTDDPVVVDAVDRRGRALRCLVRCTTLRNPSGDIDGVILFMERQD